ncbi:hypothetical protein C2S52_015587 [Perilla frutescens var. hirtella]|nr:hypothetical protein C2S52_015587 [Perilla frutescens var. hirtella]
MSTTSHFLAGCMTTLKILCGWPTKRVLSYASYRIDDPEDVAWSVVLASPNKRYIERINRDDLGDTSMQLQSFSKGVPRADTSNASDDNEPPCVRNDCDPIWVLINMASQGSDDEASELGKAASQLQSYIDLLTRDHVKISIKNWKLVPDDTKDLIWEQVKATCLESANSKWRTWKCRLHKDFILPNKDNPDEMYKPPPDSGILDHDWGVFVHSRVSTKFQQLSEQQKKRRSKHLYPHRLSRKGYANYAEEIKDLHGDEEVDRCLLWKKARLNKEGTTDNENLKIAIQKIDEYIREKEEGTLHSEATSSDLLSLALDKPEHAGRVRGKGSGVKPKSYFQSTRESRRATNQGSQALCNAELEEIKRKIEEQTGQIRVLDHVVHELKGKMEKFESKHAENDKESEGLASCSVMKIVN